VSGSAVVAKGSSMPILQSTGAVPSAILVRDIGLGLAHRGRSLFKVFRGLGREAGA
jgi:hypothetical protein